MAIIHLWFYVTILLLPVLANIVDGLASEVNRRSVLVGSASAMLPTFIPASQPANAFPLFEQRERRQLELCLVNVLRLQYWATNISDKLQFGETEEEKKKAYLEARLGAKAMVADKKIKISGGASLFVITLRGLQMKDCLDDLKFYAKSKQMDQYRDDLIESLASLVEFDGLETTQDPSPRSSLTLGMYNADKNIYVRRMLKERITPVTEQIVDLFGKAQRASCEGYLEQLYPSELPRKLRIPQEQQVQQAPSSDEAISSASSSV